MNSVQNYIMKEADTQLEKGIASLIVSNTTGYSDSDTIAYMKSLALKNGVVIGLTHESDARDFFIKYYQDIETIRKNNLEWMKAGERDLINYLVLNTFELVVGNMLNSIELDEIGA